MWSSIPTIYQYRTDARNLEGALEKVADVSWVVPILHRVVEPISTRVMCLSVTFFNWISPLGRWTRNRDVW